MSVLAWGVIVISVISIVGMYASLVVASDYDDVTEKFMKQEKDK